MLKDRRIFDHEERLIGFAVRIICTEDKNLIIRNSSCSIFVIHYTVK